MIEHIVNIGNYLKSTQGDDVIDSMVNEISTNSIESILNINVYSNEVETFIETFYPKVTKNALFYQSGNGVLGGGIRMDYYKNDPKEIKKFEDKVKKVCNYCEVDEHYNEILESINNYIINYGTNAFVLIKKDGKNPIELFKDKFLDKMYSTMYKSIGGKHTCHFCGTYGKSYNSVNFKMYTNDKEVYGNVDHKEKSGVVICKDCLDSIIIGKNYCEKKLSTFWNNNNIMFLPHLFNEDIASVYEDADFNQEGTTKLFDIIKNNEEYVLDKIGKTNSETDMLFYEKDGNKTFYIYHRIRSLLPSRFSIISQLLKKYQLKMFIAIKYVAAVKFTSEGADYTNKEIMRFMDCVFSQKKIDRNLFFKRSLDVYKCEYLKDNHKKFRIMNTINKIYNFLVECGCLEGDFNCMKLYKDYIELFNENKSYFNSNEKKAWFLVGKCYDLMNYYIKSNNSEDGQALDRTSLDKNFFFARKFDFNDFIYFCNLLNDKATKYKVNSIKFSSMICEAKDLMAKRENDLSYDEAKYLFFWGMDSYFGKETKQDSENETELEK